jgi:hypothetical protein
VTFVYPTLFRGDIRILQACSPAGAILEDPTADKKTLYELLGAEFSEIFSLHMSCPTISS